MQAVSILIERLLPLYGLILLGYVAGKLLDLQRETIARLVIYVIMPGVVLHAAATTKLSVSSLSLPVIYFSLGTILSFLAYWLSRRFWSDSTPNLLAFAAGTANTGYFGIPVAAACFGDWCVGLVIFANLGLILFENGVGFYHLARSSFSWQQSLRKIAHLPALYAFALGLAVNLAHVPISPILLNLGQTFRDAYTLLGMMIIGLGLAALHKMKFDFRFLGVALGTKFLIWPAATYGLLALDRCCCHLLNPPAALALMFMAFMPMAANTVVFSTELKVQPEKAALAVVVSTLLAIIIVPLAAAWLGR
jgi:hypothetical protein